MRLYTETVILSTEEYTQMKISVRLRIWAKRGKNLKCLSFFCLFFPCPHRFCVWKLCTTIIVRYGQRWCLGTARKRWNGLFSLLFSTLSLLFLSSALSLLRAKESGLNCCMFTAFTHCAFEETFELFAFLLLCFYRFSFHHSFSFCVCSLSVCSFSLSVCIYTYLSFSVCVCWKRGAKRG